MNFHLCNSSLFGLLIHHEPYFWKLFTPKFPEWCIVWCHLMTPVHNRQKHWPKERIKKAIAEAETIEEVTRLEKVQHR